MSVLSINGLTHMYDSKVLFEDAELKINNGEHAGIVGLNGAGKSTLLYLTADLLTPKSGQVYHNGTSK